MLMIGTDKPVDSITITSVEYTLISPTVTIDLGEINFEEPSGNENYEAYNRIISVNSSSFANYKRAISKHVPIYLNFSYDNYTF
jgi:hypothetical protein